MKHEKGDEIFIKAVVVDIERPLGQSYLIEAIGKRAWVGNEALEKIVVNHHPAQLAPDGWQPRKGERVLVEATVELGANDRNVYALDVRSSVEHDTIYVHRSSILGPAPEKPSRFKVGDEVLYRPGVERGVIARDRGILEFGKHAYDVKSINGDTITANEDEIIPLDEARELLKAR